MLAHELILDNATFRLQGVTPAWTRYLLMNFRASAVSDDKRDFMLRLCLNMATEALPDAMLAAISPLLCDEATTDVLPQDADLPPVWDRTRVLQVMARALPPRLNTALGPFVKGMRRRLGRDQDQLHQYHNDLHRSAMARAVVLPEGDPKRLREQQRAAAIEREYAAKLDYLARQYSTRVTMEWVQTLELVMPVHRFTVQV